MDIYDGKRRSAEEALSCVRSGLHVFIGSGAAEPQRLVEALAGRAAALSDIEVLHLMTLGAAPYAAPGFEGRLRHNALFIGPNTRAAVAQGLADYTPCSLSELPSLIRCGRVPVDVALIQVTPPENGFCSLGLSVDVVKAAMDAADVVVAQVNSRMPKTEGDSRVLVDDIDAFVVSDLPIPELKEPDFTAASLWIGRFVARLVADGSTLQIGAGAVPNAVLAALAGKKDLGMHSELISDGLLPLLAKGVVTGRAKTLHREKIVASLCMGSRRLYDAVDRNPSFEFHPSDYVNSPAVIALNERMVAVNSALQVDLTGQVAADSIGRRFHGGVGGQADFMRGASLSRGGRSIIAVPSTAGGGKISRIAVAIEPGTGICATRSDVDFVVTEYGIASLKGRTIRERAVALIGIAHPDFRERLTAQAREFGYLDAGHVMPPYAGPYLVELEAEVDFDGLEVFFRPIKPSDERWLKDLFYRQSMETTYLRYGIPLKNLSEEQFQKMVAIDFRSSMAIAGFVRDGHHERMIAVGRYVAAPGEALAEATLTVEDRYQGRGIGTFLLDYLAWIARERGVAGFKAEVVEVKPVMRGILAKCFRKVAAKDLGPDGTGLEVLLGDWKGRENPASARTRPPPAARR